MAVAEFLVPIVANRSFLEIGTRRGDISACLAKHAASSTAIEVYRKYCHALRQRGLSVLCSRVEDVPPEHLLAAEVIYFWPNEHLDQTPQWLHLLLRAFGGGGGRRARLFIGHDAAWPDDRQMLAHEMAGRPDWEHLRLLNAAPVRVHRVHFDEEPELAAPGRAAAAYAPGRRPPEGLREWGKRRGRWGTFLLAEYPLGGGGAAGGGGRADLAVPPPPRGRRPASLGRRGGGGRHIASRDGQMVRLGRPGPHAPLPVRSSANPGTASTASTTSITSTTASSTTTSSSTSPISPTSSHTESGLLSAAGLCGRATLPAPPAPGPSGRRGAAGAPSAAQRRAPERRRRGPGGGWRRRRNGGGGHCGDGGRPAPRRDGVL